MLKAFLEKRKLGQRLREFVTDEAANAVVEGRPMDAPKIQAGRIEFVFALVRADTPQQLSERIGLAVETSFHHDAVVHSVVGPLVVIAFGTLPSSRQPPGSRKLLIGQLRERIRDDIKIVHGTVDGHFGPFGGKTLQSYTFTFPGFDSALARLGRLEFGQAEEFLP